MLSAVSRVHDVLKWANRTAVAEEITRRGYRVSPETLNRWVRQDKEVPAIVEHIVFELFGIGGHAESPQPQWAGAMEERLAEKLERNRQLIGAMARPELLEAAERVIARLEALEPPDDAAPNGSGAMGGRAAAAPPGRGPG